MLGALAVAGAAGEVDYDVNTELFGKKHRILVVCLVFFGNCFVGMQRVSVAGERADCQAVAFYGVFEFLYGVIAFEEFRRLDVGRAGIAACADFNRVKAHVLAVLQHLFEGTSAEERRHYAYLHLSISLCLCRAGILPAGR